MLTFHASSGFKVVRESFALPMREAWERLASFLTWRTGELVNRETKPNLYRTVMQKWGSSRRQANPDHWVERMAGRLIQHNYEEKKRYETNTDVGTWRETLVLIDDIRYTNEVELIRDLDGVVVFVDPKKRIDLTGEWRAHESEALAMGYIEGAFDDEMFDEVIVNNKTTQVLFETIRTRGNCWLSTASTSLRIPSHMKDGPFGP